MTLALTRASTVGPIAGAVEAAGGSVSRLLRAAELPALTLEQPERLILLRDQFRLVECAARMIGDDALPARLAIRAGLDGLGAYGGLVLSFPDLGSAISLAYLEYGRLLQAATRMELSAKHGMAVWSYLITSPLTVGRQKNELLAVGYMLAIIRSFAGWSWTPDHIEIPGALSGKQEIENIYRASIRPGPRAAVVFPTSILDIPVPGKPKQAAQPVTLVPPVSDVATVARLMIDLERDADRYGLAAVAARMGMTPRTLQRLLSASGWSYSDLEAESDRETAIELLERKGLSVTETAACLGYSDVAHFSRAFRRWTGLSPSRWRLRASPP